MTTPRAIGKATAYLILALGLALTSLGVVLDTSTRADAATHHHHAVAIAATTDTRPCVSLSEYQGLRVGAQLTRTDLERRWDVVGLGVTGDPAGTGVAYPSYDYARTYPACGYPTLQLGAVLVVYRKTNDMWQVVDRWTDASYVPTDPRVAR